MALYDVVNGIYRKVCKKYDSVDGVYRSVKAEYDPVNGVYRRYFSSKSSIPASELEVGDSVWLDVGGVPTEFIVVHQGNPRTTDYDGNAFYDESCNGTWLLMKDIYSKSALGSGTYPDTTVHAYLNGDFLDLINVKDIIKQVKIPYSYNTWMSGSYWPGVKRGENGLLAKVFLLNVLEVSFSPSVSMEDGARLSYFNGASNADRIAYYNGAATDWWLRGAVHNKANSYGNTVTYTGSSSYAQQGTQNGVRPAFILNSDTLIDESTHTIIE